MARPVATYHLYEALKAEGYRMPDEVSDVYLTMPIDGLYQLHYTINLQDEDLAKLGRALQKMAEASLKKMAETPLREEK